MNKAYFLDISILQKRKIIFFKENETHKSNKLRELQKTLVRISHVHTSKNVKSNIWLNDKRKLVLNYSFDFVHTP